MGGGADPNVKRVITANTLVIHRVCPLAWALDCGVKRGLLLLSSPAAAARATRCDACTMIPSLGFVPGGALRTIALPFLHANSIIINDFPHG